MRSAVVALVLCLLAVPAISQVCYVPDNNPAVGAANAFPFSVAPYTSIHTYYASQLLAAGVCGGAGLTDFAIAPAAASALYTLTTGSIKIGHLTVSPPIWANWTTHLTSPITVWDTAVNGPLTMTAVASTWLSIPGFSTAGFVWDGVSDIGIIITSNTGYTGGFTVRSSGTNVRYGTTTYNATNQAPTTTGVLAMKARLTFAGGTQTYQLNQPNSSFDFDGTAAQPCRAAVTTKCNAATTNVNFASALVGSGWDLAYAPLAPLVPLGGGGLPLPASGQIVNMDLTSPGLGFLNNLTLPPFPGGFTVPLTSAPPLSISAQMLVIDPTNPDFLALSAGGFLVFSSGGTIAGPVTNDAFITVNLGVPPLCGPSSISYYGTTYTQLQVTTNGRVMFGTGAVTGAPSLATAITLGGTVGSWMDLNQAYGGSISLTALSATVLRISYTNVPYVLQPTTSNSFAIEFDTAVNSIKLTGLAGIQTHPLTTGNAFVGLSKGAGATTPAASVYSPPSAGITSNATDMIYSFGQSGLAIAGLSSILYLPNSFGNYDWISF